MNYLAHLYLSQSTSDSHFGNLLGDFRRGVNKTDLAPAVLRGLENHLLVDKFTDHHQLVKNAKQLFSEQRRRFAGVAIDVAFDHFLIRHWHTFTPQSFSDFRQHSYALLNRRVDKMPPKMQSVVTRMCEEDWFATYASLDGIDLALNNIAKRIRFENTFHGAAHDIAVHYAEFEEIFLAFFPQLQAHVHTHNIEGK
ncbi:ACP phosphodiesterase [Pseudoalteromonas sp. SSDWG2]|uniref:acyl carrier protein phosphodiesterase n=1 Tax=Pseudoalteromonas sp. SSDWG2 TaxID=3139391 RepID=UPI003BA90F80